MRRAATRYTWRDVVRVELTCLSRGHALDPDQKIARPRQLYKGREERHL